MISPPPWCAYGYCHLVSYLLLQPAGNPGGDSFRGYLGGVLGGQVPVVRVEQTRDLSLQQPEALGGRFGGRVKEQTRLERLLLFDISRRSHWG